MRAILTYHSIDDSGSAISVSRDAFERHVRWLASGAVRVTTLEDLATLDDGRDAVAITFDDGFESVATIAAPLLRQHGLPATLFVVTDHVGGTNAWGGRAVPGIPEMPLLDWDALRGLVNHGFALGAHSRSHPDLTAIGAAAARDEIAGSVERLAQETGVRPSSFAYPYGAVNREVAGMTGSICRYACTADLRPLNEDDLPALLPRLDAYYFQRRGQLEGWGRSWWHGYLNSRAFLRRCRQMVTG